MIEINYGDLQALMTDFVDGPGGFMYLRIVGPESVTGAFWAALVSNDWRGQPYRSEIKFDGGGYQKTGIACEKDVTYKRDTAKLNNGTVDLVMINPKLTPEEDSPKEFHILTYESGVPTTFFKRLQRNLAIPTLPEWTDWLWEEGQKEMDTPYLVARNGSSESDTTYLNVRRTVTPIKKLKTLVGNANCYCVSCENEAAQAWIRIIRQKMGWQMPLTKTGMARYEYGPYSIEGSKKKPMWIGLYRDGKEIAHHADVDTLYGIAYQLYGLNFTINGGPAWPV